MCCWGWLRSLGLVLYIEGAFLIFLSFVIDSLFVFVFKGLIAEFGCIIYIEN